jgi:histidyl-tRNA synthetase
MGEEADHLLFHFTDQGGREVGLRYDFTVSLARFMAMNQSVKLPFKRYQIGSVFRAEKPQKGRFREFVQCDTDIVGTTSPYADAEIIALLRDCFVALGMQEFGIVVNDRRLLAKILSAIGIHKDMVVPVSRTLDKLDKAGTDEVMGELSEKCGDKKKAERLLSICQIKDTWLETLEQIELLVKDSAEVSSFRRQMEIVSAQLEDDDRVIFNPALTRGLDYYTGTVFEVMASELELGSLGGGGRYDELIGLFLGKPIPAVGVALGLDRIQLAMEALELFPQNLARTAVLVTVFGQETERESLVMVSLLRRAGISADIYTQAGNIGKQLGYANDRAYRFAVIIGPEESAQQKAKLKDMTSGEEQVLSQDEVIKTLTERLS